MRDMNSISRGNVLAPIGATHYHAQLGFSDKGRAIKGVGCLLYIVDRIYDGDGSCASCVGLVPCCVDNSYRAQVPQHPIET